MFCYMRTQGLGATRNDIASTPSTTPPHVILSLHSPQIVTSGPSNSETRFGAHDGARVNLKTNVGAT